MKSLEDDIKQGSFKNEYHKLGVNLLHTAAWWKTIENRFFKNYGLSANQYNALRILRGQLPSACSLGVVAERMIDKNSNTSRIIDKLVDKKLVDRCTNSKDRRQVDIRLSQLGINLLDDIDEEIVVLEEHLYSLEEQEVEQLNRLLEKVKYNPKTKTK